MQDSPGHHDGAAIRMLLERAASGDQGAWRRLVDLYTHRVFALARSRVGSVPAAEEITQSVFVTVASKLGGGEYAERGRFEAWLFRIAMNRIRDEIRRQRRHAEPMDPGSMPDGPPSSEDEAREDADEIERLRAAVAELSDADQEVVQLRHHAQLSFKQMSALLEEPVGTLLARHHRALAKLRIAMQADAATPTGKGAAR